MVNYIPPCNKIGICVRCIAFTANDVDRCAKESNILPDIKLQCEIGAATTCDSHIQKSNVARRRGRYTFVYCCCKIMRRRALSPPRSLSVQIQRIQSAAFSKALWN